MALDIERTEAETKGISEQHIEQKRSYWRQAFAEWRRLLGEEGFWGRVRERIRELDDPRLTTDTADRIREGLPKALLTINAMLAVEASEINDPKDVAFHLTMIRQSGFGSSIVQEALHRAVVPMRDRLKAMCLRCGDKIGESPESGNSVASDLIKDTAPLLKSVDALLAKGDSTRESLHDEVASQVRLCLISFVNKTGDWLAVSESARRSLGIAESPSLQEKIREDLQVIGANAEYSTCWFCGGDCADSDSSVTVMMHGNVERVPGLFQTQVRWQYLPVIVPRCASCKSAHGRSKAWRIGGIITAFVLAIFIGIASGSFWVFLAVLGGVIAASHGLSALTFPRGAKPESYKKEFRTVKEMLSRGWMIGAKPKEAS